MAKKAEKVYDGSTMLKSVMQETVIESILSGIYQTDAYLKVYACKSKRVAEAAVSRMLSKVKPKARLEYKRRELAKKFEVNEERITRERVKIGFANVKDFMDEKGQIRQITKIDRDNLAAVSEIKLDPILGTVVEFKFHSKQTALDGLSKQLGLYAKDNEQKTAKTLIEILAIVGNKTNIPVLEAKNGVQRQIEATGSEQISPAALQR